MDFLDGQPYTVYMDWASQAACRQSTGIANWFSEYGSPEFEAARTICRRCPVRLLCLEEALAVEERFGIWGGLSAVERERELRRRSRLTAGFARVR